MADHNLGDLVRVSGEFTDEAEAAVDPTAVYLTYKAPNAAPVTLTYLTDLELVRDAAGQYHVDIDANVAGTWYYRWWSTGTGQAAGETSFWVRPSDVV